MGTLTSVGILKHVPRIAQVVPKYCIIPLQWLLMVGSGAKNKLRITCIITNQPAVSQDLWYNAAVIHLMCLTCTSGVQTIIHSPVLAFIVAGVLWLLPFMAEMPMPYSVPGSRSEAQIHRGSSY